METPFVSKLTLYGSAYNAFIAGNIIWQGGLDQLQTLVLTDMRYPQTNYVAFGSATLCPRLARLVLETVPWCPSICTLTTLTSITLFRIHEITDLRALSHLVHLETLYLFHLANLECVDSLTNFR